MPISAQRFDSRQSMKDKRFEVFHYRDKKLDHVGIHHHDFFEVYFFLSGRVSFKVEGKSYHLEPGDLLLINPQELHQPDIGPDTLYERIVLWIDRSYLTNLCSAAGTDLAACFNNDDPNHTNLLRPSKLRRAALSQLLDRLVGEYYSDELGSFAYAQGLLTQFMVELNRLAQSSRYAQRREEPDLVSQVLSYIGNHYHENITLESLAAEFFVSKYHLSHEFSHRVGTSIYRYVIFRRLLQARELISAGQAPGEVYQSCGFGDYANFYRAFKGEYGVSPREFAAQIQ